MLVVEQKPKKKKKNWKKGGEKVIEQVGHIETNSQISYLNTLGKTRKEKLGAGHGVRECPSASKGLDAKGAGFVPQDSQTRTGPVGTGCPLVEKPELPEQEWATQGTGASRGWGSWQPCGTHARQMWRAWTPSVWSLFPCVHFLT